MAGSSAGCCSAAGPCESAESSSATDGRPDGRLVLSLQPRSDGVVRRRAQVRAARSRHHRPHRYGPTRRSCDAPQSECPPAVCHDAMQTGRRYGSLAFDCLGAIDDPDSGCPNPGIAGTQLTCVRNIIAGDLAGGGTRRRGLRSEIGSTLAAAGVSLAASRIGVGMTSRADYRYGLRICQRRF